MHRVFQLWAVREQLNWTDQFAVWIVNSGGLKEAQIQSYSPGGASMSTSEGTLAPPGKYHLLLLLLRVFIECKIA